MSVRQGGKVIAGSAQSPMDLFDFKWADHICNDVQWLRADTFSWQDGGFYEAAYNHLVDDMASASLEFATATQNADLGGSNYWQDIAFGGTKFVALGDSGYISTSTDGVTWTTATQNADLGNHSWEALAYGGTKFVALGNSGYVSTSTDGTTWTAAVQDSNLGVHNWSDIAFGNGKFIALGGNGYISTSTDGTTWTTAVQDSNLGLHVWQAIAFDGTKFVALGYNGYISTSTDGITWTTAVQDSNLGEYSWQAIAFDGTKFVALGNNGYVSTSTDGTTWTTAVQDSNLGVNWWRSLAFDGTKFVALGYTGYVSTSGETETIAGITVVFCTARDGHKICPASQETNVANIYAATGVAWYYIVDTENERFKLPRTKFGITGLRDTVGNYVAPGLPNITGYLSTGFVQAQSAEGAFSIRLPKQNRNMPTGSDSYQSGWGWDFSASDSNAIYGASTTVQAPATQMYLYFYVGQFTQTALENTAGITAETLNDKADITAITGMITPDYTAGVDISSSVTGAGYTAPKDGIIYYYTMPATSAIDVTVNGSYITRKGSTSGNYSVSGSAIVKKNDVFIMSMMSGGSVYFYPFKGV